MLPLLLDAVTNNRVFPAHEAPARSYAPSLDIVETADHYEVRLDVPGVAKKDLKLTLENETLSIEGERPADTNANAVRHERWHGSFRRALELPTGIASERIAAQLADGVLVVTLPKAEAMKPRQIEVRS